MRPFLTFLLFSLFNVLDAKQCRLVQNDRSFIASPNPHNPQSPLNGDNGGTTPTPTNNSTTGSPGPAPFNYGKDIIRAVNLGGWFVLEPWITPSFFEKTDNDDIIDEYTLGQLMDNDRALDMLTEHWETWITEDDFVEMKAAGLNHVRIPLGYWSVPMTSADTKFTTAVAPYIPGAWPHLLRALNWAKAHGLRVILDLHGAPGSQNGYDNSGQRGSPHWNEGNNVPRTLDILRVIAKQLGGLVDVLELLNEPAGWDGGVHGVIRQFWTDAYHVVRQAAGNDIKVMIGDAFLGVNSWNGFMAYPDAQGVLMDFHEYQIFNYDQLAMSHDEHIQYSCGVLNTLRGYARSNLYTVSGEWSNAITDCARWLNGRGVGARWDGTREPGQQVFGSCKGFTGNYSTWSDDYKTFMRKYFESQIAIGEAVQGWIFWTWKNEEADEWSYQKGIEGGWIPQDPTDRMYPNICSGG